MKNRVAKEKEEPLKMPEKPLGKESAVGPASRFIWKVLIVLIVFALVLWLWRLFS
jgi:hypothetical protein